MKKMYTLAVIIAALSASVISCKKAAVEPIIPAITTPAAPYFFTLDGTTIVRDSTVDSSMVFRNPASNTTTFTNANKVPTQTLIYAVASNQVMNGVGTYSLNYFSNPAYPSAPLTLVSGPNATTGSIIITQWSNVQGGIIKGTFSGTFTPWAIGSATHTVSGAFRSIRTF
jgi:hypothetical protein